MLKKNKQKILKNKLNTNILLKYELKNLILKSVIQNQNLNNKYRLFNLFLIKKKFKKNKKICLISGHNRSINNQLNMSRHNINYLSKLGLLQNFKIKSW
uniref:Ribosomal protein S14 n=1 Tax=Uronema marinum TaxID=35107 RepID=A0A345WJV1_UROMR|nr:ribosomal protein S14 [Uronema marinum]AXJ93344.1 ribosomal protein S14 [Uronema marinum]